MRLPIRLLSSGDLAELERVNAELGELDLNLEAEALYEECEDTEAALVAIAAEVDAVEDDLFVEDLERARVELAAIARSLDGDLDDDCDCSDVTCDCPSCRALPAALVASAELGPDGAVNRLVLPLGTIVAGGAPQRRGRAGSARPLLRVRPREGRALLASGQAVDFDFADRFVRALVRRQDELGKRKALTAAAGPIPAPVAPPPLGDDLEVTLKLPGMLGMLAGVVQDVKRIASREPQPQPAPTVHVAPAPAPVVHVAAPPAPVVHAHVHVPPPPPRSVRVETDMHGVKRYVQEEPDEEAEA
jgi:hypothetical protein